MERQQFEARLDRLIDVYDGKVRAELDALECSASRDLRRVPRAKEAYDDAREAFLDAVLAPPLPGLPPVTLTVARAERDRQRTRGRPLVWHRWVEIKIGWCGVAYTFTAEADCLTLDTGAVEAGDSSELRSPDFNPLCAGHSVRLQGVDYTTTDPGPPVLVKMAVEICRAVALRLHAHGLDHFAARRAWPEHVPSFEELVEGAPTANAA
jgi:hypothetical protein